MVLKLLQLMNIVLLLLVSGMYWGPWLALTRSIATFEPDVFLAIVQRLNRNMEPLMTALLPLALLSTLPVLVFEYGGRTFYLTLTGFVLFVVTLLVTVFVEVPIVKQIVTWTALPDNWQQLRDRWGAFHYARIVPSLVGLVLILIAAIF